MAVAACGPAPTPTQTLAAGEPRAAAPPMAALPDAPLLSAAGLDLIYEFEVSGQSGYNRHPYPEWPQGESGVTWGIGYDATAQSAEVIREDWSALGRGNAEQLSATHPYHGEAAREHLAGVSHILVPWDLSTDVFGKIDLARTAALCRRTFPGFDGLKPNAKAAILSLVFNRGNSLAGPSRVEMRAIRDAIPHEDYRAIAQELRAMERVWEGKSIAAGMRRRREAEARLVESCL